MFNLNWCRNICHEGNDDGTISGKETKLAKDGDSSLPITTYFYNGLYKKKTIDAVKPAVICSERSLSFGELDGFSTALAEEIKAKLTLSLVDHINLNPEEDLVVATCLPPSEKLVAIIFAILKAGASYLPLDPMHPELILLATVEKFRPLLIIADENGPIFSKYDTEVLQEQTTLVSLEDLWLSMNLSDISATRRNSLIATTHSIVIPMVSPKYSDVSPERRCAVIIQTTDISSDPRGVRISHLSIMNQISWSWREVPFSRNGACCLTVPISTVCSLNQIFSPLLKGVTLHILTKKDTKQMDTFIRRIGERKITRIYLIPVVLRDFLNECFSIGHAEVNKLLHSLNYVICQGDVLPKVLAHLFFVVFPHHKHLTNMYGCVELGGDVVGETFSSESDVEIKSFQRHVTFGKCIDNTRIHILGFGTDPMSEWQQGEISVSGLQVSLGYVNMENYHIEHVFVDNPFKQNENHGTLYRTGIYGRLVKCEDDRFRLLIEGRGDEIIRHQGFEFNLDDVRAIMGQLHCIRFMETILYHPGQMDQELIAFIVPTQAILPPGPDSTADTASVTAPLTVAELDFELRTKLPEFMIPEITIVKNLPFVNSKGKGRINQSELIYAYQLEKEPNHEVWSGLKMQNSEMHEAARTLFLGMYKFCSADVKTCIANMDAPYFNLGVNSLNIVCLSTYISSSGYEIHLREMLSNLSIHSLISLMVIRKAVDGKKRRKSSSLGILTLEAKEEFSVKILDYARSKEAFRLVATAYTEKGELENYNMVRPSEYIDFLTYYFNAYKEQSLCFYVTQKPYDEIVAVCLAHDFFTDFNIKMDAALMFIIDITQEMKGANLSKLPHKRNKILELFIMATHSRMTAAENVQLVLLMFAELSTLAEKENFTHIYVNSTNQLIRDLCSTVLGYKIVDDFPIRDFTQKGGFRPYRLAPPIICMTSLCCRLETVESRRRKYLEDASPPEEENKN